MPTLRKKISHLYWRAGFGISLEMLDQKSSLPLKETISKLLTDAKNPDLLALQLPIYEQLAKEGKAMMKNADLRKKLQEENRGVNSFWIRNMATSKNPLLERMTLFWHGHFAMISRNNSNVSKNYINTLRTHALGNFGELVLAIARDPGMIKFLNNQQNKKGHPNENFARELLELFTMGIGHYSEQDIKEAARAFTGWRTNKNGVFTFSEKRHDYDRKTFLGQEGDFNGEDIIRIILEKKQTAKFIATKVYQYFVNQKINQEHVQELAYKFYNSNYSIEKLMRTIFESNWFYAEENIGTKIKSPIDLLVGMMKTLQLDLGSQKSFLFIQKMLGQILLNPPNVAGWAGGPSWIDNATLVFRLNLAGYLFKTQSVNVYAKPAFEDKARKKIKQKLSATMDLSPIIYHFKNSDEAVIYASLSDWLIQTKLNIKKSEMDLFTKNDVTSDYVASLVLRLMTLPEYQVC